HGSFPRLKKQSKRCYSKCSHTALAAAWLRAPSRSKPMGSTSSFLAVALVAMVAAALLGGGANTCHAARLLLADDLPLPDLPGIPTLPVPPVPELPKLPVPEVPGVPSVP
ncbi:unnamed protein product, partial [Urochloa humidicola]